MMISGDDDDDGINSADSRSQYTIRIDRVIPLQCVQTFRHGLHSPKIKSRPRCSVQGTKQFPVHDCVVSFIDVTFRYRTFV
jgi:hypothetical protein